MASSDLEALQTALAAHLNTNGGNGVRRMQIGDKSFDFEEGTKLLDLLERLERRNTTTGAANRSRVYASVEDV